MRLLVLLLIVGLLIIGCTSPNAGGNANPGSEGTPSGGNAGNGNTGTTGTQGSGNAGSGDNSGSQGAGGSDLLGKTYEQLIGLGVPLKCDIAVTDNGKTIQSTVYMKGENEVRSEYHDAGSMGSGCTTIITIMKGDMAYMGCEGGNLFPDTGAGNPFAGCKWIETRMNSTETAPTGTEAPDYSDVPPTQISCTPWIYDPSKFVVDGKSCNLQDMMAGMGGVPGAG
jgi:uncharacterized protein YceK